MTVFKGRTRVPASSTAHSIAALLAEAGADQVMTEYATGPDGGRRVSALSWTMTVPTHGQIPFRLPVRVDQVHAYLKRRKDSRIPKTYEHAEMVAWRQAHAWVQAQLAFIQSEMVGAVEVFLPYVALPGGRTFYEQLESGNFKALPLITHNQEVR